MLPRRLQRLGLRPRRHPKEQDFSPRPAMVRQPRGHRWRTRPPSLGRARALRRLGNQERLAYTGMGQTEVIIDLRQYQLLPHAVLAFAQSRDPPSHSRAMLADAEVEAFDERRIDLPATGR